MKKLFIHLPLFRILSPLFSGVIVYLLILLINNNVEQLGEYFLGQELYVCIALAFIIQEYSRFSLIIFSKFEKLEAFLLRTIIQFTIIILVSMIIVTIVIYIYFSQTLGYTPNNRELMIFNSIFGFITLIYMLLYKGNQLMYTLNKSKLADEKAQMNEIKNDFYLYRHKINSDLLYDCLEALIVTMKKNPNLAESITDDFSKLYRYTLLKMDRELVQIDEEIEMLDYVISIYHALPYRKVSTLLKGNAKTYIPPGSLIYIFEKIIRSTIFSKDVILEIEINTEGEHIEISYEHEEKLNYKMTLALLEPIAEKYRIYSDSEIKNSEVDRRKIIRLPKLQLDESSINRR